MQIFCIQTCQGIMWKNQTLEVDIVLQESDICQSTSLQQIHWNYKDKNFLSGLG